MRKTLVTISTVTILLLAGCTNKPEDLSPTPTPAPSASGIESTNEPEPTTPAPKPQPTEEVEPEPTKPTADPEPGISPTVEAGTPATQFASRWGKRYPDVPEYAILKAANGICAFTAEYGNGWERNPLALAGIREAVQFAGIAENDALEFAQDANQNYCASVSNPT